MPRIFTQKHYVRAADDVAKSTGPRHEKVAYVANLAVMFTMDAEDKFDEVLFLKAAGFEGETVRTLLDELNAAADAAGTEGARERLRARKPAGLRARPSKAYRTSWVGD